MYDGQGSALNSRGAYPYYHYGGVVFGYDEQKVKLWASDIALFSTNDGWGLNQTSKTGTVFISGWNLNDKCKVYRKAFTLVKNMTEKEMIPFPWSFDFSKYLVSVKIKITTQNDVNEGMIFKAEGSSFARSSEFGGIIYVYTKDKLLLYQPSSSNGHLVFVGDEFGSNTHVVEADEVEVEIVIFHLSGALEWCDLLNSKYKYQGSVVSAYNQTF